MNSKCLHCGCINHPVCTVLVNMSPIPCYYCINYSNGEHFPLEPDGRLRDEHLDAIEKEMKLETLRKTLYCDEKLSPEKEEEKKKTRNYQRKPYLCGKCGKPKRKHQCTVKRYVSIHRPEENEIQMLQFI